MDTQTEAGVYSRNVMQRDQVGNLYEREQMLHREQNCLQMLYIGIVRNFYTIQ